MQFYEITSFFGGTPQKTLRLGRVKVLKDQFHKGILVPREKFGEELKKSDLFMTNDLDYFKLVIMKALKNQKKK